MLHLLQLTILEQEKIVDEYRQIIDHIEDLLDILGNPDRLTTVIRDELIEVKDSYGDERRTEILEDRLDLTLEDLITEEDVVVTLSHTGYAKSQPLTSYTAQRRGGRGRGGVRTGPGRRRDRTTRGAVRARCQRPGPGATRAA